VTIWLDEQISPFLAPWIEQQFGITCSSVTILPVDRGADLAIFLAARGAGAIVISKDSDFVDLAQRLGTPPPIIRLRMGNCSNTTMRLILSARLQDALDLIEAGEPIVELS